MKDKIKKALEKKGWEYVDHIQLGGNDSFLAYVTSRRDMQGMSGEYQTHMFNETEGNGKGGFAYGHYDIESREKAIDDMVSRYNGFSY